MSELTREIFDDGISRLKARGFSRIPTQDGIDGYYRYLRLRMDDAGFRQAIKTLFAEARGSFPIPVDFEAAAPGGSERVHVTARDPYWQRVSRVLKDTPAARGHEEMFDRREASRRARIEEGEAAVEHREFDDSGPPFFFPKPLVEIVDSADLVGVTYVDREDLRQQSPRTGI